MSKNPPDSQTTVRPQTPFDIDGLGASKRQRTGGEDGAYREAGDVDRGHDGEQEVQDGGQTSDATPAAAEAQDATPAAAEAQEEGQPARAAIRPEQPTEAQRAAHELTHCPYRSWCRACVLGRGRDRPHHRVDHSGDILPRVAMDYMFFTDYGIARTEEEARELIE